MHILAGVYLVVLTVAQAPAQSKGAGTIQPGAGPQRGTDSLPVAVRLLNTGKSAADAAQEAQAIADTQQTNRRQFWINIGLLFLTVVQSIGLIVTIGTTNRTNRRQLRAYVLPDQIDAPYDQLGTPAFPIPMAYALVVRNYGTTPAYKVSVIWSSYVGVPNESQNSFPELAPSPHQSTTTLGPNCTVMMLIAPGPVTPELRAELNAGSRRLYVYGEVTYRDTFGKLQNSKFRFGRDMASHAIASCNAGNDAT
jgi:hypothetical protein